MEVKCLIGFRLQLDVMTILETAFKEEQLTGTPLKQSPCANYTSGTLVVWPNQSILLSLFVAFEAHYL